MRKNRRIPKKMSVIAATSMRFGAIIVLFFVMVILNLLASSNCDQLLKAKGALEIELGKLEKTRTQEASRWEEMLSSEWMESALLKHGLKMTIPRPDQIVRLRANGLPYPGQVSVARARRSQGEDTASYSSNRGKKRRVR